MEATESEGSTTGRARAAELLRAAGILLHDGSFPQAVELLHAEAERVLGQVGESSGAPPRAPDDERPAPAAGALSASAGTAAAVPLEGTAISIEQVRERHVRLAREAGVSDALAPERRWWSLLQDAPTWVAWGLVLLLAVGFGRLSLFAVSRESQWKDEFPDGAWLARYYRNTAFEGAPLTRAEPAASHEFRSGAPAPGMPKDRWAARWDTCLVVKERVELSVKLASDDASRLLLDDALQVEIGPRPGKKSAQLVLEPGVRQLTLELVDKGGRAYLRVDGLEPQEDARYTLQHPQSEGSDVRCE